MNKRTCVVNLSIGWDVKSVRGWSTIEDQVRDLSGWIGAGALLEWRWSCSDEAANGEETGECELHDDGSLSESLSDCVERE